MTVHQLRPNDGSEPDAFGYDDVDPFGSRHPGVRDAHRVVNPLLLTSWSKLPPIICGDFHHVIFSLLEAIGEFDGLIATSGILIAPRVDRFDAAERWVAQNPEAAFGASCLDVAEVDRAALVQRRDLDLAAATDANPSRTFASVDSLVDRLDEHLLDLVGESCLLYVEQMTVATLLILRSVAGAVVVAGGASCRSIDPLGRLASG